MFLKKPIPAAVIALSMTAAGCGGGSSNGVSATPGSASGIVADGYLSGATVCLDINTNKICDAGEPSATTGTGGAYTLAVTDATQLSQYPVLVEVPATAIDEDTGVAVGKKFVLSAPVGKPEFISPLTTMVQNQIEANPGMTADEAENELITSMGKDPAAVSLFTDYVEAKADTTNAAADDYSTLHNIAQVTARTLANNIETIEAAVNDLQEAFDALIQIVVEEVVAQLATITTNVETAEAASTDGTIDADAVTTSTNVAVATTTLEAEVAVVEATNSATVTTFEQQLADGFNWLWSEAYSNQQEIEYGTVTVTDGIASETQYEYNFTSGEFVALTASSDDLYLGANGWTAYADDLSDCTVTFNSNGSGTFACLFDTFTVSAQAIDVAGLNIKTFLDGTDNGDFGSVMSSTAVFSAGAKAYQMSFTNDVGTYELYSDSTGSVLNSGTESQTTLASLLSASAWTDDGNSEPNAVWAGFKRSPEGCVEEAYSTSSSDTLCNLSQGMLVELVGSGTSGTAKFYLTDYVNRNSTTNYHSVNPVASSTWSIQTVNGVEILSYVTPATVANTYAYLNEDDDNEQRIYSVYNNVVYQGGYYAAGSTENDGEVAFNNTGIADVIGSIGAGSGTTSTNLACNYESGWNDTTDQPTTFNSYTDFETVVTACGGLQSKVAGDIVGTWTDTWTEGAVVWVETIIFNSNGSFTWSETADDVQQGADDTGTWAIANNLLTLTGTDFVDVFGFTVSGGQKVYTEETDWGSNFATQDGTAEGEIWNGGLVKQQSLGGSS